MGACGHRTVVIPCSALLSYTSYNFIIKMTPQIMYIYISLIDFFSPSFLKTKFLRGFVYTCKNNKNVGDVSDYYLPRSLRPWRIARYLYHWALTLPNRHDTHIGPFSTPPPSLPLCLSHSPSPPLSSFLPPSFTYYYVLTLLFQSLQSFVVNSFLTSRSFLI